METDDSRNKKSYGQYPKPNNFPTTSAAPIAYGEVAGGTLTTSEAHMTPCTGAWAPPWAVDPAPVDMQRVQWIGIVTLQYLWVLFSAGIPQLLERASNRA